MQAVVHARIFSVANTHNHSGNELANDENKYDAETDKRIQRMSEYSGYYKLNVNKNNNAFVCLFSIIVFTVDKNGKQRGEYQNSLSVCLTGLKKDWCLINHKQFNPDWIGFEYGACTLTIPSIGDGGLKNGAILTFMHVNTKNGNCISMAGSVGNIGVFGYSVYNNIAFSFYIGKYYKIPKGKSSKDRILTMEVKAPSDPDDGDEFCSLYFNFDGKNFERVNEFSYCPDMYCLGFEMNKSKCLGAFTPFGLSLPQNAGLGCQMTTNGASSTLTAITYN